MRTALTLVVVVYVLFCGWLIVETGLFDGSLRGSDGCILLQQTTPSEPASATGEPEPDSARLKAAEEVTYGANHAPARTIMLGAADPNTENADAGFKFQLELSSKGAAIRKATFSNGPDSRGRARGFDDRDHKDPQPLTIISPVKDGDSEILAMANRSIVFVDQGVEFGVLDKLHWKSVDSETTIDTARFEASLKNEDTGEPVIRLIKTYRIRQDSYLIDCDITVENLGGTEQTVGLTLAGPCGLGREAFRTDMRKILGGFEVRDSQGQIESVKRDRKTFIKARKNLAKARKNVDIAQYNLTRAKEDPDKAAAQEDLAKAKQELATEIRNRQLTKSGADFLWAAAVNKYFAAIAVPLADEGKDYCDWLKERKDQFYNPDGDAKADSGDETLGLDLGIAPTTLGATGQADSSRTYRFQIYLGPKDKSLFDKNEQYNRLGF
jgi:hypothetical protein